MKTDRIAIAVFFLLALALLLQFLQPYPMPAARTILPPELPQISNRLGDDVLSVIKRGNIWHRERESLLVAGAGGTSGAGEGAEANSDGAAATEAAPDNSWQLIGVSGEGRQQFAVIDSRLGMSSYQVGETLPDGATVTKIMAFGIQVNRLGQDESVYLFGKE